MRDLLTEVFAAMRYNKMRIGLTGFSIGWGIFLLIVMIGSGNGVLRGITNGFVSSTDNIINVNTDTTTLAYHGLQKGRGIQLTDDDCRYIQSRFSASIKKLIPQLDTTVTVCCAAEHVTTTMNGYYPNYLIVKNQKLAMGRDINQADIINNRKVCVISQTMATRLFHQANPVGQRVSVYDISFVVVGVVKPNLETDDRKTIVAPFTTVRNLYFRDHHITTLNMVMTGLDTEEANNEFVNKFRSMFSMRKNVSSKDVKAIAITNDFEYYLEIIGILKAIQFFVWIVGLATLVAGVVGISNIMLITVKERMRELGVRKAMGASSFSIIRLVLLEAVFITVIFGYVGMLLGIGLTQLADSLTDANSTIFCHPTVSFSTVMIANGVLLISGIIAGYVPAKRAVTAKLVDALAGVG